MPNVNAQRVTILLRDAAANPGYQDLLALLASHGVRDVFGVRPLEEFEGTSDSVAIQSSRAAMVYWIDSPARVERLLPNIRSMFTNCLATIDETTVAFDSAVGVPDLPASVIVSDVMTREVISVEPDVSVDELVYLMVRRNLRGVPVLDDGGRLAGIVTNSDLVARAGVPLRLDLLRSLDPGDRATALEAGPHRSKLVGEIMTRNPVSVPPEMGIQAAAQVMLERRLKRLPVTGTGGILVGILSRIDLLRAVSLPSGDAGELADHLEGAAPETRLRDVMSRTVPEVAEDATLSETLAAVMSTRLNRAIVVDSQRRVVGIVSDADLLERLTPQLRPGAVSVMMRRLPHVHTQPELAEKVKHTRGQRARDLMRPGGLVLREDDGLGSVVASVLATESKAVPIVDAEDRVVGVIDRGHLLWAVLRRPAG